MTTMSDTDPMLAKVRKLLAKAEDPATTPEEAELYTAKAAQLIADYGIDRALLAASDPSRDPVGERVVLMDAPYAADKADLLSTVAHELRCRVVQRTRHLDGVKELSLHLFGHESDLQRVEVLYTSLLLQAIQSLTRTPVPPHEHKAAFRRSWLAGFTGAIRRRLADAERRAAHQAASRFTAQGHSSTLVLADRATLVQEAVTAEYPHLRVARPRTLSGSGGRDGWAAGQRADLGGTRLGPRGVTGILPS
jgi:hypothetical protein